MKKNIISLFACLLAMVMFLTACGAPAVAETQPEPTPSAAAEPVPADPEPAPTETDPEPETPPYEIVVWETEGPCQQVELSGNPDERFLTTDHCYVQTEHCLLILDKDLMIPGDFGDIMDAIVEELEGLTGLSIDASGMPLAKGADFFSFLYGYNPWADFDFNAFDKLPVMIRADREDVGYICSANPAMVDLFMPELYSEELWNSIPTYRDNPWRRSDHIRYVDIAHEMTHVIQMRNTPVSKIMQEGSAEYFQYLVVHAIAQQFSSVVDDSREVYGYNLPRPITAENAEEIFLSDYAEISHADRGAEYEYGRRLCAFLHETYGDSFYADYLNAIIKSKMFILYVDEDITEQRMETLTQILKDTFGETVFEDFGNHEAGK